MQAADGNFYGTTYSGGTNGVGSVFRITPSGTLTSLCSFTTNNANGPLPVPTFPAGTLAWGTDGFLYGTTEYGSLRSQWSAGTAFKISTNGTLTTLYGFNTLTFPLDGFFPRAGLVQGSDGNFYGTCHDGGANGNGTVFRITPAGTHTVLIAFDGFNDGASPQAALVTGSDGIFYGTTTGGGWGGQGTIFRLSIAPQITSQPASQIAFVGASATFSVGVFGSAPLSSQWRKNGINLTDGANVSGSGSGSLTLSNLVAADAGTYSVIVSNSLFADPTCSRTSAVAVLTITSSPPVIVLQPASQTVPQGAATMLAVGVIGNLPLGYQWLFDGTNIAGATAATLAFPAVQPAQAGNYTVSASNNLGSVTSAAVGLRVLPVLAWGNATNHLTLTWTGPYVLQSATNAAGPYFDVLGAASPYVVVITSEPHRFFRLRAVTAGSLSIRLLFECWPVSVLGFRSAWIQLHRRGIHQFHRLGSPPDQSRAVHLHRYQRDQLSAPLLPLAVRALSFLGQVQRELVSCCHAARRTVFHLARAPRSKCGRCGRGHIPAPASGGAHEAARFERVCGAVAHPRAGTVVAPGHRGRPHPIPDLLRPAGDRARPPWRKSSRARPRANSSG